MIKCQSNGVSNEVWTKRFNENARQRRKFEYARSDISKAIINLNNAALSSNNSKSGAKENKRSKRNSVNQLIK